MIRINIQLCPYRFLLYTALPILVSLIFHPSAFSNIKRQNHKVTIAATNIPLEEVFKKINQQTGLIITNNYQETKLNNKKTVTVNFLQTDISEVMLFLLNDSKNLDFLLQKNSIVIFKRQDWLKQSFLKPISTDTLTNTFELSGKIVDMSNNSIPGATLKIKDSKQGTISNLDGSFHLSQIENGSVIIISSIGFETKEIVALSKNIIVRLKPQANNLDEKIVIAYGSTTKRLNTGNITSIKATEIEKQPVSNVLLSLQGRVPGVVIQQASGLPGTGVTIRIQGLNSLLSGNDPFFVIDGVPYISQLLPVINGITGTSGGSSNVSGNPLNYLNSSDIESIEILKDADATAIYGSRAANGAVLITTKKGKSGETKTEFTIQSGWGKVGHMLDLLNTRQYLEMRHEALSNDGIATPSDYDYDLNGAWDTTRNINWQKELIGHTSQYTNAQVTVSGGSPLTQYLIGAGYNKQTTVFPGSYSDTKGSLHFNINNTSSNKKFKVRLSASYMFDNNKLPLTDLTTSAITLAPVAPEPYTPEGSINWKPTSSGSTTFYLNPLAVLNNKNVNKINNLTSNLVVSYEILPGLEVKSSLGYNNLTGNETTMQPLSSSSPEDRMYTYRASSFLSNRIISWLAEPQIEYKKNIGKSKLTYLLGTTISQRNNDQSLTIATGFNNDLVMEDFASAPNLRGSNINSVYKYNALYSRLTYNWDDKYIINLNARRDGSSRFGSKNQFHNFGSLGVAWIFSQESFIQNTIPFLSFGKLRGSYGTTGNDQIEDYLYLDLYRPTTIIGRLYQDAIGLSATRLTNPYLQWEETKKFQVGLELGFIKDKILFTANYNRNRSSNQLLPFTLPIITGFQSITRNFPAVVQNTGWELTLNTVNIKTRDFSWTSNVNLTIPKNQLLSFSGADSYGSIMVGKSITMQKLFHYNGINAQTGTYEFKDAKGNITQEPSDPDDKISIVSPDPKFYGGLQNSFTYKGFSVDLLFIFCKQNAQDNLTYGMLGYLYPGTFYFGKSNQSTAVLDRWQKPGDKAKVQAFSSNDSRSLGYIQNSDAIWTDASYLKLKNISISWQIPQAWERKAHLQSLRVFMSAQNLFTITKFNGFDPESPGLGLPPLKVVTFGAQITL